MYILIEPLPISPFPLLKTMELAPEWRTFSFTRKEKNGRRSKENNSPSDPFRIPFISHHSLTFGSYSHMHTCSMCSMQELLSNCKRPVSEREASSQKNLVRAARNVKRMSVLGPFSRRGGKGRKVHRVAQKSSFLLATQQSI